MIMGGQTRYCLWCGTAYTQCKKRHLYCSYKCEHDAKKANMWKENDPPPGRLLEPEVHICKTCGKPFVTTHEGRKYCSDKCRYHKDIVKAEMEQSNGSVQEMSEKGGVL